MTKIALTPPTVGEKDTVAEPLVTTAIKEIETFLNGKKLDSTDNIKAEGVTEAALTKELQEKLSTRLGFIYSEKNESFEAVSEKLYGIIKTGATVTLPKPAANRIVAGFIGSATTGVKVKSVEGKLYGDFLTGANEAVFESNQHFIFAASGTNWFLLAGEPKREQKYTAAKTATGVEMQGGFIPSTTRPAMVTVSFSGTCGITVEGELVVPETTSNPKGITFYVPPGQGWKLTEANAGSYSTILL